MKNLTLRIFTRGLKRIRIGTNINMALGYRVFSRNRNNQEN